MNTPRLMVLHQKSLRLRATYKFGSGRESCTTRERQDLSDSFGVPRSHARLGWTVEVTMEDCHHGRYSDGMALRLPTWTARGGGRAAVFREQDFICQSRPGPPMTQRLNENQRLFKPPTAASIIVRLALSFGDNPLLQERLCFIECVGNSRRVTERKLLKQLESELELCCQ